MAAWRQTCQTSRSNPPPDPIPQLRSIIYHPLVTSTLQLLFASCIFTINLDDITPSEITFKIGQRTFLCDTSGRYSESSTCHESGMVVNLRVSLPPILNSRYRMASTLVADKLIEYPFFGDIYQLLGDTRYDLDAASCEERCPWHSELHRHVRSVWFRS